VIAVAISASVSTIGFRVGIPVWLRPVIAAVIALAIVYPIARGLTSPLRAMVKATKDMAAGRPTEPVAVTSRDEVGELARSFNEMRAQLDEVDRQRRDLVANVSHELRTPISALQATLENLVDGVEAADPETLDTMLTQVVRLGRLVTQLLDLSRLESGAVPLDRQEFAIEPVLVHAVRESKLHAPDVEMTVQVEPNSLAADGDPERVHQVVANLLENAVRHSPEGGAVRVRARRGPRGVRIEVLDDGPGIPVDEATRVFERFYRSDSARATEDGGAGLGLAIAQWIVELHGGEIHPERREPHGCRMVVTIPAAGPVSRP
jgi:signal transduction histidine kinase